MPNLPPGPRLLACFAHPDDEAFPVGGALAAHAARGIPIRLITATLGEEGEIRQPGAATRATLGAVRQAELARAVRILGLHDHILLHYRDSGMAGDPANRHPNAFINAPPAVIIERLTHEIRRFRPQVVLTFDPAGLYGHPDHIAICQHTTAAFHRAADPDAYPQHLVPGITPWQPQRLFYSARPRGFRMEWAQTLRAEGIDFPLPDPHRAHDGAPPEDINLELDVSPWLELKMGCILSHRTQIAPDWPYDRASRTAANRILGREYYIRAHPPLTPGETIPPNFFAGL